MRRRGLALAIIATILFTGFATDVSAELPELEWDYYEGRGWTAYFKSGTRDPSDILKIFAVLGSGNNVAALSVSFGYAGYEPFNLNGVDIISKGDVLSFPIGEIERMSLPSGKRSETATYHGGGKIGEDINTPDLWVPFLESDDVTVVLKGLGSQNIYRSMTIEELQIIRRLYMMYTLIITGEKTLDDFRN